MSKRKDVEDASISEDDSDSSMDDIDEETSPATLTALESAVAQNPGNYEAQMNLWNALNKCSDLERVRAGRMAFHEKFPLSSELWKKWISDEERVYAFGSTPEQYQLTLSLYDKAHRDYAVTDIWLNHASFVVNNHEEGPAKAKAVRAVYESALAAVGGHMVEGSLVWQAYLDYEKQLGDEERIRSVFQKWLSVPLQGMEKTKAEYEEWEKSVGGTASLPKEYTNSLQKVKNRKSLEDMLEKSSNRDVWMDYLNYEIGETAKKDPARVVALFERCIVELSIDAEIWTKYLGFLREHLNVAPTILPVCERAVRNCPWISTLWTSRMRAMERFGKAFSEIEEVYRSAASSGLTQIYDYLELFTARIDMFRRQHSAKMCPDDGLRQVVEECCDFVEQNFPGQDTTATLARRRASIELRVLKNPGKALEVWEGIVKKCREFSVWAEYLQVIRDHGPINDCRAAMKRALQQFGDGIEIIADLWMSFERERGSLEDYEVAVNRIEARYAQVGEKRMKDYEAEAKRAQDAQAAERERLEKEAQKKAKEKERKKMLDTLKKRKMEDDASEPSTKKRKFEANEGYRKLTAIESNSKTLFMCNVDAAATDDEIHNFFDKHSVSDIRIVKNNRNQFKGYCYVDFESKEAATAALQELQGKVIRQRPVNLKVSEPKAQKARDGPPVDKGNVFVVNIGEEMAEDTLREAFAQFGEVKDIRIVKDKNDIPKGFAYVDYEDESAATAAIAGLNGKPVDGRILSVEYAKSKANSKVAAKAAVPVSSGPRRGHLGLVPRSLNKKDAGGSKPAPAAVEKSGSDKPKSNSEFRAMLMKK